MKKFLIIFGSFILFLITFGTLFKLMHWPGGSPLLVIGMTFFSGFFIPLFFIDRMIQKPTGLNITTNIFALFSTMMLFMGVLFKVMHWPGAGPQIVFGAFFFIFPTLILYVVQQFKEYDRKFREFWRTLVLGILVSVFFIFWGVGVSRSLITSFMKVEDATLETNMNLKEFNSLMLAEIIKLDSADASNSSAKKIAAASNDMVAYIENVKKGLINGIESDPEAVKDHWRISAKDNYDRPTHMLCGEHGIGRELFEQLNNYNYEIREEMKKFPPNGAVGINMALNPELMEEFDNWQDGMFEGQTIAGTLALLSSLQNDVLNSEFKSLKTIRMNLESKK